MKFTSTRDKSLKVGFLEAVLNCVPQDGGFYVPCQTEDLRRWCLYTDEKTPFASIAGSLTSAFIRDEFSPIICETIATKAFYFSPDIKQLDNNLFFLDLTKGPTGIHRDFGISYLASCIETISQLYGKSVTFLDVSAGELGASLAVALRNKKHIKAVIVYPKGKARGLKESDFIWNGGNIYPVEVDGSEKDCHELVDKIFTQRDFVQQHHLSVANTTNIGRLLPQAFFYPFAFSRIKNKVNGEIFYALSAGNYSNLVAGLYAWQFALPLNGFIVPSKDALTVDAMGNPLLLDSIIPIKDRKSINPSNPSNLERLEDIFAANKLMMRHLVFPMEVTDLELDAAEKELFLKYNIFADFHTARVYAAAKKRSALQDNDCTTVLVARDHPSLCKDFIKHSVGEIPEMPKCVRESLEPTKIDRPLIKSTDEIKKIIESIS